LIATGPNVSVNTILGLPFMQGMGMILDLVDNTAECKYLDCPPFLIDFRCTSNHVPVTDEPSATVQLVEPTKIIEEIKLLERYIEAKVQARGSRGNLTEPAVHFGTKSAAHAVLIDFISMPRVGPIDGCHPHQSRRTMMITMRSYGRTGLCELQPMGYRS